MKTIKLAIALRGNDGHGGTLHWLMLTWLAKQLNGLSHSLKLVALQNGQTFLLHLLSEALPGNPTVVVKFMPGAGSTKGCKLVPRANKWRRHSDVWLVWFNTIPLFVG